MQQVTVNHNWLGAGTRVVFSLVAATVALVAGFLLFYLVGFTVVVLFAPNDWDPWWLVLWSPYLLWLGFLAKSAAAKDGWVEAAKRLGLLVTATIAALFVGPGIFLIAVLFLSYAVSLLYWLLIPLIFAGVVAAVVWLARRSRISKLPWFVIGLGASSAVYMALFFIFAWVGGD